MPEDNIEDQMRKAQVTEQPKIFKAVLVRRDPDMKQINVSLQYPPTTTIVLKQKEAVFIFSQVEQTPEGDIFVYLEASALLFDLNPPKKEIPNGAN